jgi:lipid-binding SYLF domain-containing protein
MKTASGKISFFFSLIMLIAFAGRTYAQSDDKKTEIINDSKEAKEAFLKKDPSMAKFFSESVGYAIFPNVGKGAFGVGGAAGNGVVYDGENLIGSAKMTQVSVGFQLGGQAYREVIFFESAKDLEHFKNNKLEFSAQVSAVAASSGVSANAKYKEGVAVFTMEKGGLMYEASLGGQKFKFTPNESK